MLEPGSPPAAGKVHFRGLNSLRFLAALFVVVGHIPMNQGSLGLPAFSRAAFFYRGEPAVSFFFCLSGFLITYLLLEELRRTGEVDVGKFYVRRICRIWPLYFAVVTFGLFFYNALLPALGITYRVEYEPGTALLLYALMLPNLMNSLYTVGGILNPLWSIGVEEQFYLSWAPAVRRLRRHVPRLCAGVFLASFAVFLLNHLNVFGLYEWKKFVGQLKFHFMAAGGLCAWWLHRRREALLALPPFRSRLVQIVLLGLLLDFYLVSFVPWTWWAQEVLQVLLYGWLLVTVAANPRNVVPVENRLFDTLGNVSYGIYMLHMIAVYATSALFQGTDWWRGHAALYYAAYYALAVGGAILLALLSHRLLEQPFLRLKDRRFSLVPTAPAGVSAEVAP
jgi:peptidoglycan/LPS O-acetylase OafA/YrhL